LKFKERRTDWRKEGLSGSKISPQISLIAQIFTSQSTNSVRYGAQNLRDFSSVNSVCYVAMNELLNWIEIRAIRKISGQKPF
jgi:hypothetical protein